MVFLNHILVNCNFVKELSNFERSSVLCQSLEHCTICFLQESGSKQIPPEFAHVTCTASIKHPYVLCWNQWRLPKPKSLWGDWTRRKSLLSEVACYPDPLSGKYVKSRCTGKTGYGSSDLILRTLLRVGSASLWDHLRPLESLRSRINVKVSRPCVFAFYVSL